MLEQEIQSKTVTIKTISIHSNDPVVVITDYYGNRWSIFSNTVFSIRGVRRPLSDFADFFTSHHRVKACLSLSGFAIIACNIKLSKQKRGQRRKPSI